MTDIEQMLLVFIIVVVIAIIVTRGRIIVYIFEGLSDMPDSSDSNSNDDSDWDD